MTTDRVTPEPEPGDVTPEPVDSDVVGDPTIERPRQGRTYDDETPAAELEATDGGDAGELDTPGATGLSGLDTIDPGRHHV